MAKRFYTERDIEDLAAQGILTLTVDSNVILTGLAEEKAQRLGVKLVQSQQEWPSSTNKAVQAVSPTQTTPEAGNQPVPSLKEDQALRQRIHRAVRAKFGDEIDPQVLDRIISRVLDNIGG